ncbi:MAG: response regulator transcription factor [Paraclostridium sp.]|uniref:response regulator transcription factor n=1 Tax=Paraclostridium sp. TaxID=2023273 RepID=UPI003F2C315D
MNKTILILEDDESLNNGITFKLKKEGYNVLSAMDISTAKELFKNNEVDLIVSDINLPDGSGLKFCEEIRQVSDVLIVFLTVLEREIDIVTGYEIGADDYITKPFSLMVFISKINALMKRLDNNSSSELLICHDIVIDRNEMKLIKNNEEIAVSKIEYKLLKYMMENSKQILTKDQILTHLWDTDKYVEENAVAVNIKRLRAKVEDEPSMPEYIKNIRGVGYVWAKGCVKK